jgi:hypothetical protein
MSDFAIIIFSGAAHRRWRNYLEADPALMRWANSRFAAPRLGSSSSIQFRAGELTVS